MLKLGRRSLQLIVAWALEAALPILHGQIQVLDYLFAVFAMEHL